MPWTTLSARRLVHDRFLTLDAERVATDDGTVLDPFYVIHEHSWVCCVPVLPDGRLVLVEQYRHGAQRTMLEWPAGDIDGGETPEQAMHRELREETGHTAIGALHALGRLWPEPSRNRSSGYGFLAHVGETAVALTLDHGESLRVHRLTLAEVRAAEADGRFAHAVHVALLYKAMDLIVATSRAAT